VKIKVRLQTDKPTSELHIYDKDVAGEYQIEIPDDTPREEISEVALDLFHGTVPIKVLDDFWIEVILPEEGRIYILGVDSNNDDEWLSEYPTRHEADESSDEWCEVYSTSLRLALQTYELAFDCWQIGEKWLERTQANAKRFAAKQEAERDYLEKKDASRIALREFIAKRRELMQEADRRANREMGDRYRAKSALALEAAKRYEAWCDSIDEVNHYPKSDEEIGYCSECQTPLRIQAMYQSSVGMCKGCSDASDAQRAAAPTLLATLEEVQSIICRSKKFTVRKDFHLFNIMAAAIKEATV